MRLSVELDIGTRAELTRVQAELLRDATKRGDAEADVSLKTLVPALLRLACGLPAATIAKGLSAPVERREAVPKPAKAKRRIEVEP